MYVCLNLLGGPRFLFFSWIFHWGSEDLQTCYFLSYFPSKEVMNMVERYWNWVDPKRFEIDGWIVCSQSFGMLAHKECFLTGACSHIHLIDIWYSLVGSLHLLFVSLVAATNDVSLVCRRGVKVLASYTLEHFDNHFVFCFTFSFRCCVSDRG